MNAEVLLPHGEGSRLAKVIPRSVNENEEETHSLINDSWLNEIRDSAIDRV